MAELEGVALASLQSENIIFVSNDEIANSSYLDFTGYRITNATTVVEAYGLDEANVAAATTAGINVAIILDRVQDPTTLLSQNWGTRQTTLAQLENNGTLWDTYGADQAQYDFVVAELAGTYGLTVLDGNTANGNYISSAESRTIWVAIDTPAQFMDLFGKTLYANNDGDNSFLFWNGNLSLPSEWNVQGLWFDTDNAPPPSNMTPGASVTLPQGPQSIGNSTASVPNMAPQDIAALYNFPLLGQSIDLGMLALIEPGIGDAVTDPSKGTFERALGGLPAVDRRDRHGHGLRPGPRRPGLLGRLRASVRSMSASLPPSTPTATSASTTARATTATPRPRSSPPCRARSGTWRTTRASSPARSATRRACRPTRPSTRPTGSSSSTPPCATSRCSAHWATAARATRPATA